MLYIRYFLHFGVFVLCWHCSDVAPTLESGQGSQEPLLSGEPLPQRDMELSNPNTCTEEICDGIDNDCDGLPDENLICACSEDRSCYGDPPETQGIGECQNGERTCGSNGEIFGECEGWIGPQTETCDELDNDCDGQADEGLLNECGQCGELPVEVCDEIDNDCDGQVDERLLNECGQCGELPVEVCDEIDNDCDGQVDEGVLSACGSCEIVPIEMCDGLDNDCDGQVDEGVLSACGNCDPEPEEVCDLIDNDCDGQVDEQGCVIADIDIEGDCVTVECPSEAPYPIACDINFRGSDPRGCVAYMPGESTVYFQEGNDCGSGRVIGTMTCSTLPGGRLNEMSCPINKEDTSYPRRARNCPDTN